MVRVLKILIGTNHASDDEIKADICSICGILAGVSPHIIHVSKEHTMVVFLTDYAQFEVLKKFTGSIARRVYVKSDELTPNEALVAIRGVAELENLEFILRNQAANPAEQNDIDDGSFGFYDPFNDILSGAANSGTAADSSKSSEGDEWKKYLSDQAARSDPAQNINPAANSVQAEQNDKDNENVRHNDQHAMGNLSNEAANSVPAENINSVASTDQAGQNNKDNENVRHNDQHAMDTLNDKAATSVPVTDSNPSKPSEEVPGDDD